LKRRKRRAPSGWRQALTNLTVVLALFIGGLQGLQAAPSNALADYVARPDDSFAWKEVGQKQADDITIQRLEYTSQTWRSHPWRHQMLVVRPRDVRNPDIAFFLVTGDNNLDKQVGLLRTLALRAGAVAAVINKVPNQPLYGGRKEDALVAYTFEQYVNSGDATWPLLFPMVKSAIRGMDALQAVAQKEFGQRLERFVVSGASKRGWTTWLTAAADPRVAAIAPMVIDTLNMKVQTQWAAQMYGRQSEKIKDYTQRHLTERQDDPRVVELRGWVDPYSYRTGYTLPKLLLLGTNDRYWVVDSLRNYWDGLPGPKLVFQTPNAGHDLAGGREARPTLAAFFQMVADRQPLPQMSWEFKTNSAGSVSLEVAVNPPAKTFRLWTANSADRDFRGDRWSSVSLPCNPGSHVLAKVNTPEKGFRAFMVEAEVTAATGETYKLSTEARVTPDGPPAPKRQ
jgi:PhoPQ-activated pathogenicity-related protein